MIEAIDLAAPIERILQQLATSHLARLPVFRSDLNNIVGIHQRRLLGMLLAGSMDKKSLLAQLAEPYLIPAATPGYSYAAAMLQGIAGAPGFGSR